MALFSPDVQRDTCLPESTAYNPNHNPIWPFRQKFPPRYGVCIGDGTSTRRSTSRRWFSESESTAGGPSWRHVTDWWDWRRRRTQSGVHRPGSPVAAWAAYWDASHRRQQSFAFLGRHWWAGHVAWSNCVIGTRYTILDDGVRTFRRQTLRRQCRTFRRHIQLYKDRIPRRRHLCAIVFFDLWTPSSQELLDESSPTFHGLVELCKGEDCEDVGEDVGVVECGLYATVCVGETSDIVGVTSVGETSVLPIRLRVDERTAVLIDHTTGDRKKKNEEKNRIWVPKSNWISEFVYAVLRREYSLWNLW